MKKTGLTMLMAVMICAASFAGDIHKTDKQKAGYMAKQDFRSDFQKYKPYNGAEINNIAKPHL